MLYAKHFELIADMHQSAREARELAAKVRKLEAENKRLRKALTPMTEGLVFLNSKHVKAARKALGLPEPVYS
jgi:hypothetical protein